MKPSVFLMVSRSQAHPRLVASGLFLVALLVSGCDRLVGHDGPIQVFLSSDSDADMSAELVEGAQNLAALLTVQREGRKQIPINPAFRDWYYRALVCIYNAGDNPGRLPIRGILGEMSLPRPYELCQLSMSISSFRQDWTDNLINGVQPTGNPTFDGWVDEYSLRIIRSTYSPRDIVLAAPEPLNMLRLSEKLRDLPGVSSVEVVSGYYVGLRNPRPEVMGKITPGFVEMEFTVWWAAGGKAHIWKFRVRPDGRVLFVSEWGDLLPDGI